MKNKSNIFRIILALGWILFFTWNNGFGLEIDFWVYIVAGILWILYLRFNKIGFLILLILFFINLNINHLFGISGYKFIFNIDQINITNYKYIETINRYRLENIFIPYKLRVLLYSSWLLLFYWLDSFFKILSPLFWSRVLGFSGLFVGFVGIFKTKFMFTLWLLVVCLSSSLAMLYDTKTAVVLALPALICILSQGINSSFVKKYWWIVVILVIIDILQK